MYQTRTLDFAIGEDDSASTTYENISSFTATLVIASMMTRTELASVRTVLHINVKTEFYRSDEFICCQMQHHVRTQYETEPPSRQTIQERYRKCIETGNVLRKRTVSGKAQVRRISNVCKVHILLGINFIQHVHCKCVDDYLFEELALAELCTRTA
ncbi:hypothetical protein ANN_00435 [Periplaneta americana]|uniref:Uncharacterized protein n=1 Tax=Periplaneta americana TaxID=6978 RepID=A0ABQ8TT68_PERAM|nr:hypothetical protein ANN_00435 [Periplaneta americana]